MSAALSVRALSKRFGELQALRDVSFDVDAGELVAVIGPNGAGKTTLLSIIAGLQAPTAGTVSRGADEVGWVPQQPALYTKLSVAENLALFAHLEKVGDPRAAVERMLEQTDLRDRASERVGRLSGGNRQRVNVALGLIGDPPVLALDEPSAALDPAQRERLWAFIAGLALAERAVLFSTHNVAEAQRYAGRVIVLANGRMLFDGPPLVLLREVGEDEHGDLERALVRFLAQRAVTAQAGER
ncbi:MAG: heme exporter protein CcmA [Solirubrobacterales bacterium]|nr:heme exporter protein CcmA [Solirubrobacterales bacterium]